MGGQRCLLNAVDEYSGLFLPCSQNHNHRPRNARSNFQRICLGYRVSICFTLVYAYVGIARCENRSVYQHHHYHRQSDSALRFHHYLAVLI